MTSPPFPSQTPDLIPMLLPDQPAVWVFSMLPVIHIHKKVRIKWFNCWPGLLSSISGPKNNFLFLGQIFTLRKDHDASMMIVKQKVDDTHYHQPPPPPRVQWLEIYSLRKTRIVGQLRQGGWALPRPHISHSRSQFSLTTHVQKGSLKAKGELCQGMFCAQSLQSCLILRDLWTVARQASLPMGFSRQEYWSGFPLGCSTQTLFVKLHLG